jgi:hypothetical protein
MPEPVLYRHIHVVAREGELGDMPKKVADICAATLRTLMDVKFIKAHSWAAPHITVAKTPHRLPEDRCIACGPAYSAWPPRLELEGRK